MKAHAPNTVKLELTEGCNLRCSFCGIQGIREKAKPNFKWLSVETADRVGELIAKAGWRSRFEMAMHGEPTMNPRKVEIVAALRKHLPKNHLMITSNGGGLLKDPVGQVNALLEAGLNVLALDDYKGIGIVPKIVEALEAAQIPVARYPQDGEDASPYKRRHHSARHIVVMPDISDTDDGVHSANIISNHCGAAFPPNDRKAGKRCARPFRELAISYDGTVILCCNDWRRSFPVMSVHDVDDITDIWDHPAMVGIRKKLYRGERDIGPCDGCDSHSVRVGLLPDPMGLETLPPADESDIAAIRAALSRGPMTAPVLREWEK